MHIEDYSMIRKHYVNNTHLPKRLFVASMIAYGLFLLALSLMRYTTSDESGYLTEAAVIADALSHGKWIGELSCNHGFLLKTINALLFLLFGKSVFIATLFFSCIALLTFWLCNRVFNQIVHSQWWALIGTWLVFANPITISCSYKNLVDVPAMGAVLLISEAVFKRKSAWIIGVLLLLATDVREYLLFIVGPALVVWLVFDQVNRALVTYAGATSTNEEKHVAGRLYYVLSSCLCCIGYMAVRIIIIFSPVVLYIVLMLNTSLLPTNPSLVSVIRAFRGAFISQMFMSPKQALRTEANNVKAPQIDLINIQRYAPVAVQKTEIRDKKAEVRVAQPAATPALESEDRDPKTEIRSAQPTAAPAAAAPAAQPASVPSTEPPKDTNTEAPPAVTPALESEVRDPKTEISEQIPATDTTVLAPETPAGTQKTEARGPMSEDRVQKTNEVGKLGSGEVGGGADVNRETSNRESLQSEERKPSYATTNDSARANNNQTQTTEAPKDSSTETLPTETTNNSPLTTNTQTQTTEAHKPQDTETPLVATAPPPVKDYWSTVAALPSATPASAPSTAATLSTTGQAPGTAAATAPSTKDKGLSTAPPQTDHGDAQRPSTSDKVSRTRLDDSQLTTHESRVTQTDLGPRTSDLVAEPPVTPPAVTAPAVTAPAVSAPAVTAPAVSAPAVSAPAVSAPAVSAPAVSAPAVTAPAVSAPAVSAPAVTAPAVTAPAVTAPAVTAPAVTAPAVTATPVTATPVTATPVTAPAFAEGPSTKDQGQSTAASSTTEDRGPRTEDRVQNSVIHDPSSATTHDSQLTTHDQTPSTKDQGLSTSHIPQTSASPGLLDSPTSRRADEASQSTTAPVFAAGQSTKDQGLRTPPPPQPKPVVRKPMRQQIALQQNHGLLAAHQKRSLRQSAAYASFLGDRPDNRKPSSLSRGVLACSLLSLPHGSFAIGASMCTTAFFDIVNLLLSVVNALIIYSLKIVHPQTFNFNKMPLVVVFLAVPAALILSWSWLKQRKSEYIFLSMTFLLYMTIHIVKWSSTRYMLPFYPVVVFFFLSYLKLLSQRTVLTIIVLVFTIVAVVFSLNIDLVNIPIKVGMTSASIIAVLILVIARKRCPAYANMAALCVPVLIAFFTLSSSLYLMLITPDNQGAPIKSFFEYGYNRECATIMSRFTQHSTIWLNDVGTAYLPYFYRPNNADRTTYLFDARSYGYLRYQAQKLAITEIGLTVSELPGRSFENQGLLADLKRADWLELREQLRLKNKTFYLFSVHLSKQPVNSMPHNRQVAVGLTPMLSFSGDSSTSALLVTQWQIREVNVLAAHYAAGITNFYISTPQSLSGSSWMSADVAPYEFDGKSDYIDCNIAYQNYTTLSIWVKPRSTSQQSIIAGNFAGLANNYWNTYGKGFQYFNGSVYAMGDFDGCRKKLSAPVGDQEWSHIVATFSSNGTLYVNGDKKSSGDIGAGYMYSFAIGAGRKHRLDPASTLNELNFDGNIDDIRVYNDTLTAAQISNIWLSTRDHYANYALPDTSMSSTNTFDIFPDYIMADHKMTVNAVLFSDNAVRFAADCSISVVVKRIWDSGVVTNDIRSIVVPEGVLTNNRVYYWQIRYKDDKGMWSIPSEPTRFETITDSQ